MRCVLTGALLTRGVSLARRYRTLQGRQPGPQKKPNQDSLVVEEDLRHLWPAAQGSAPEGDSAFFGVFDGHGPHGEHASVRSRAAARARR